MNALRTLSDIDRLLENRIRLAIMAVLVSGDATEFTVLRNMLGTSDGNLSTHATALERAGYLTVRKGFQGRKPRTTYAVTERGRKAFGRHVDALEAVIRGGR